ncbi:MAG: hypothetical protein IJU95_03570 [Treponema sp.]|nr:hypothetical protein [Treponema sp.]
MYFAQLYQINLSMRGEDLLGARLVRIPAPSFVVFYNGDKEMPDLSYQRLSDAFETGEPVEGFEWTATVLNIGGNHNEALQKKCRALYDYSRYVGMVKKNLRSMEKREAVSKALDCAISENLLDGYFKSQKMEVLNMSLTEFNQEEYDRNRRREGFEEGVETTARRMLARNYPLGDIAEITGLTLEQVEKLDRRRSKKSGRNKS